MSKYPILLCLSAAACVDRFETEPAYAAEEALCGAENAATLQQHLAACAAESGKCDGVLGFEGKIDGQSVLVGANVEVAVVEIYRESTDNNGGWDAGAVKSVELTGRAPYFEFRFIFDDLGGVAPEEPDFTPRTYAWLATGSPSPDDTRARLEVSAGGTRSGFAGSNGGVLELDKFSRGSMAGSFSGQYGSRREDVLTGCFAVDFSQIALR